MLRIATYIILISILSACAPTKSDIYRQCKRQVEIINKMHLYATHLVPVDSLGEQMNDEVISDDMYDHCEVVPNANHEQTHTFAMLYFDNTGLVRKSIEWWSDGGDLRKVGYYDEHGNIIYAIYNYYDNNYGKLYAVDSKRYMEHPFLQFNNDREISLPELNVTELATRYKANLQMPDDCRAVSFMPIQKGDMAFLCTNSIYTTPQKCDADSKEIEWGSLVYIDSIANGWCRIKKPFHNLIGFVPVDSLELAAKK